MNECRHTAQAALAALLAAADADILATGVNTFHYRALRISS